MASLIATSTFAMEIKAPTEAINIAGKQRMFTQRMLKDYAMIGMGNTFGKPEEDLKKTISDFDEHLKALMAYTKSAETKKSLEKVASLWAPIEKVLLEQPTLEKVNTLQKDLDALLAATNEATQLFTKEAGVKSAEIVNIAGRQRMLSQRMASLYMLKVWGNKDPEFAKKLKDSMGLFKESLVKLQSSELTTDEIQKILKKVQRSFMFFEMMNRQASTKFIPTLIYKKSNDMLVNMNEATLTYVKNQKK